MEPEADWEELEEEYSERTVRSHEHKSTHSTSSRTASTSPKSKYNSMRKQRSDHDKNYQPHKVRSLISPDKLKWNGSPSTYDAFAAALQGTLMQVGAAYLLDEDFHTKYLEHGI